MSRYGMIWSHLVLSFTATWATVPSDMGGPSISRGDPGEDHRWGGPGVDEGASPGLLRRVPLDRWIHVGIREICWGRFKFLGTGGISSGTMWNPWERQLQPLAGGPDGWCVGNTCSWCLALWTAASVCTVPHVPRVVGRALVRTAFCHAHGLLMAADSLVGI